MYKTNKTIISKIVFAVMGDSYSYMFNKFIPMSYYIMSLF